MTTPSVKQEKEIRQPSLLDALIPLFFLITYSGNVFGFAGINVQRLIRKTSPHSNLGSGTVGRHVQVRKRERENS